MAILFWFYKEPVVCQSRVECIRRLNPGVPVFGLYGGRAADRHLFEPVARLLDDCWDHPPMEGEWGWFHGDKMITNWFAARGKTLAWETLFIHHWDLLMTCPVSRFSITPFEVLLPGLRPVSEVEDQWYWSSPSSPNRKPYEIFLRHPSVQGSSIYGCVFLLAVFPRGFLADYGVAVQGVTGMVEYRLPTMVHRMGYVGRNTLDPWWPDRGDGMLNGNRRGVSFELVCQSIEKAQGRPRVVWHPVYEAVTWAQLEPWARREAEGVQR